VPIFTLNDVAKCVHRTTVHFVTSSGGVSRVKEDASVILSLEHSSRAGARRDCRSRAPLAPAHLAIFVIRVCGALRAAAVPPPVVPTVVRDGGALKATRRASFGLWGAAQRTDQRSSPVLKPTLIFWDRGLASAKKSDGAIRVPCVCLQPRPCKQAVMASGHGKRSWQGDLAWARDHKAAGSAVS